MVVKIELISYNTCESKFKQSNLIIKGEKMNKIIFEGSATALVTPYTPEGKVNYRKLDELIEFQIENGTDAILVCGTTGEASTMSDKTQANIVYHAAKTINGRVKLLAGAGSNDTKHGIKLSQMVEDAGADAILSVTPYYNKTTQSGLIKHYTSIADNVSVPIILYNVPSRTGVNILPGTVRELSYVSNICGIKECNFSQVAKIRNICGDNFAIYSGEDALVVPLLSLGGNGVISVVSNIMPKEVSQMVHAYFCGDLKTATKLQLYLMDLIEVLFCEVNPIPVKAALNLMGRNVGKCIEPLTDMLDENFRKLDKVLMKYGLII